VFKISIFAIVALVATSGILWIKLQVADKNYAELGLVVVKQKGSIGKLETAVDKANAGAIAALTQRDNIKAEAEQYQTQAESDMQQLNVTLQNMAKDLVQRRDDDIRNYYEAGERRADFLHRWSLRLDRRQESSRPSTGDGRIPTTREDQDIPTTGSDTTRTIPKG